METESLKGTRFVSLVRCSTMAQAGTSTEDQERLIKAFGEARGMVWVRSVRLEGQSGLGWRELEEAVESIIEAKRRHGGFEAVVIQGSDRLTRSGADHGHYLAFRFKKAGLRLIHAGSHIDDPRLEAILRTMEYEVANGQVRAQSWAISRGLRSSLVGGKRTHCTIPPYGMDRLILNADGKELYRIRNKTDGSQVKVRPDSEEEYEPLPPTKKNEPPRKHRKAKHERAELAPGDPAHREVIAMIYRRHFVDDLGAPAIARELNEMGIPSPRAWTGSRWMSSTVRAILGNPVYGGVGVGFRSACGRITHVGVDAPEEVATVIDELDERLRPPVIGRPKEVWVRAELPRLAGYLPTDLRASALAHHEAVLTSQAGGHTPTPRFDPHRASEYVLKGLLETSDGLPMTGTGSGKGRRYYRVHPRDARAAGKARPTGRVAADLVEDKVLDLVRSVVLADPTLESRLADALRAGQERLRQGEESAERLESERRTLLDQVQYLTAGRAKFGDAVVDQGIAELRPKLEAVTARLAELERAPRLDERQISARAAELTAGLRASGNLFEGASSGEIRGLLQAIVAELTIDLETCELTVTLRGPSEVAQAMGPGSMPLYEHGSWTHDLRYSFAWEDGPCPSCRRKRAA